MNCHKLSACLIFFLLGLQLSTQAQLPLRNSRWQGATLAGQPVQLAFRNDSVFVTRLEGGAVVQRLRYEQAGDTLLVLQASASSCGTNDIGAYRLEWFRNSEQLVVRTISDPCAERNQLLSPGKPLTRALLPQQAPRNWSYLDPAADSVAGISLYRAYDLLKGRPSTPVIVGVIDSGVDINHEDLRDVVWVNPKEIAGNDKDDDKNGYADDLNGWNFMGAKDGTTYENDHDEVTQIYVLWRDKFDKADPEKLNPAEKKQYQMYQRAKKQFLARYQAARPKRLALGDTVRFWQVTDQLKQQLAGPSTTQKAIREAAVGTDSVALAVRDLLAETYDPRFGSFTAFADLVRQRFPLFRRAMLGGALTTNNPDYKPRQAVGDNPADPTERYYGSPRLNIGRSAELGMHGTHVAGIIGAKRDNGRGIDGVADNVRIMMLGAVPSGGDERDKDVANSIRYAVENGAKVINMSFGKRMSPFKEQVDAAIRLAEQRDVLIVHSSGNNGENYDSVPAYPSAVYEDGTVARNVLVVGNSTWRIGEGLPSRSSNYGKQTVDLFAPGTEILSTLPNDRYASLSGTSMSAPCATGVAALLRSYFPDLTALQVKEILMNSTYKPDLTVRKPGSSERVPFSSLSRSGGLLNAYEAVRMAMQMTGKK